MKLELSRWELRRIQHALFLAGEWEYTVIDAYQHLKGHPEVRKAERQMNQFKTLRSKIIQIRTGRR